VSNPKRRPPVAATAEMMVTAARLRWAGADMVALLLRRGGYQIMRG